MFIEAQITTLYRTGIVDYLSRELGVSKADDKSVEISFRSVTNIVQRLRGFRSRMQQGPAEILGT